MSREITESSFLKDVAIHKMDILRDEGVYRHLRFKRPESMNMQFDLITWPGHLCYTGDMGTFVFERANDMFAFFRTSGHGTSDNKLYINTGYWGEKCVAIDKTDGIHQYSPDRFMEQVNEWIAEQLEDEEDEEYKAALIDAVQDDLLDYAEDGEHEVRNRLRDFEFEYYGRSKLEISDTFEWVLTEKSLRFVWCCYALSWGIQQYDAAKACGKE